MPLPYNRDIWKTAESRFWKFVDKNGPVPDIAGWDKGRCWMWKGAKNGNGYGNFSLHKGITVQPYRFSYSLVHGAVAEDLEADHLCRNRECVNHEHIEMVTHKENNARGMSPSAIHARKTHCARAGHPLFGENLYVNPQGQRQCMECRRRARRESYRRINANNIPARILGEV